MASQLPQGEPSLELGGARNLLSEQLFEKPALSAYLESGPNTDVSPQARLGVYCVTMFTEHGIMCLCVQTILHQSV